VKITIENIVKKINYLRTIECSIAEDVITLCRQQIELWKQIPYLSLMATRRQKNAGYGYDEAYEYKHCLRVIEGPPINIAIDLLSGKIVYYGQGNELSEINWVSLLCLLKKRNMSLTYFEADEIIKQLKKEIEETPDENKEWRKEMLEELKLKKISVTRYSMPKFDSGV